MKKFISRSLIISVSNNKRISYSEFFNSVNEVKQKLIEADINFNNREIMLQGIWGDSGFDGINTDDAELCFDYESLETDQEYSERLENERRLALLETQKVRAATKKKELQELKAQLEEKELYLKLKKKYE